MNKSLLKFIAGGIGLIAIAVGVLYLVNYIRYRTSPEYRAEQYFKDLERRYREDTYGGNTPEETLQLFIDALKKGDVESASRYFLIEDQPKWRRELDEAEKNGDLDAMIEDAQQLKLTKKDNERAFFIIANEKNIVEVQVVLGRSPNGRWKILEL